MVANVTIRICTMRKFSFKVCRLLLQLTIIEFKTFILTLKVRHFLLKRGSLLFDRRMLLVKKNNALAQYRSLALLVNQFFDTVEKSHMNLLKSDAKHGKDGTGRSQQFS